MSKIPEQIVNAAQDLVGRFGNKLAFIGKQGDNSVYQFRFPKTTTPLPKERLNTSIDTSKKNNYIKTHPTNLVTRRVRGF